MFKRNEKSNILKAFHSSTTLETFNIYDSKRLQANIYLKSSQEWINQSENWFFLKNLKLLT